MKRMLVTVMLVMAAAAGAAYAQSEEEPLVYVVKKGDTLWGLSDRFLKDPYYWPNLWARNPPITNPHLIFPGQKVKIYPDRIVLEDAAPPAPIPAAEPAAVPAPVKAPAEEAAPQQTFTVKGAGLLLEAGAKPAGHVISTYENRLMVGEGDTVYTDIGLQKEGKDGDRFSIFQNMGAIKHPVTNVVVGEKIIPLGALQLSVVEAQASKARVTRSYREIGAGSYLLPYQERKKEVSLKASDRELAGYIIAAQAEHIGIAAGDIAFIDLGAASGLEVGNLLYVVRDVVPDKQYGEVAVAKLPVEVMGALVVVDIGDRTATALVVKSMNVLYPGDRVELKKSK